MAKAKEEKAKGTKPKAAAKPAKRAPVEYRVAELLTINEDAAREVNVARSFVGGEALDMIGAHKAEVAMTVFPKVYNSLPDAQKACEVFAHAVKDATFVPVRMGKPVKVEMKYEAVGLEVWK